MVVEPASAGSLPLGRLSWPRSEYLGLRGRPPYRVTSERSMNPNKPVHSPLSICYFSPGWPLDRFPNGVVSCVADLYAHLRTGGHKVTILANEVAEGNCDECVYNLQEARDSSGLVGRAVMGLWYR